MTTTAAPSKDSTLIVVSYETRELLLGCLESVRATLGDDRPRTIVVDNASTDGSAEAARERFPEVEVLAMEENLGFGRANNLAARRATTRFLLLLNPDAELRPGSVKALLAFADAHPEAGIFGGRTLFPDGSLNPASCWGRPTLWSVFCHASGLASLLRRSRTFDPESLGRWERDSEREVDIVSGCFLLVRRELWEELGGFDEDFFMYGEDADLCLRARRAGSRCLITPRAEVVHIGAASERARAQKLVRLFQAKALLFRKHWSPGTARVGVRFLDLWALTRMCAFGLARLLASRTVPSHEAWTEVWRRRSEWRFNEKESSPAMQ